MKKSETLQEAQQACVADLNRWMMEKPQNLKENWAHIQDIHKNIYFLVDNADRTALATIVRMLIDRLVQYGQPNERKHTIPDGRTMILLTVLFHCSMDDINYILRMLASSALQGHKDIKSGEHKNVAKMRVDMLTRHVNRDIDEGTL